MVLIKFYIIIMLTYMSFPVLKLLQNLTYLTFQSIFP